MRFLARAIGWGIVIYAIMYLLWSGLVIYGVASGLLPLAVRIAALVLLLGLATRSLHPLTAMDVVPYSVSWAVMAIILDAILLAPFFGAALYASWGVWVGYLLIALIPLVVFALSSKRRVVRHDAVLGASA